MPLVQNSRNLPYRKVAFWDIQESESFFIRALDLSAEESYELAAIKGARRKQWLASRYLVHQMLELEQRAKWNKTMAGKPFAPQQLQFNISHSARYAAAIVDEAAVGIDIQQMESKIMRIKRKFVHPDEDFFAKHPHRFLYCCIIWSVKESIYKAVGERGISFKDHIRMRPFELCDYQTTVDVTYKKKHREFVCEYDFLDNYVWAVTSFK